MSREHEWKEHRRGRELRELTRRNRRNGWSKSQVETRLFAAPDGRGGEQFHESLFSSLHVDEGQVGCEETEKFSLLELDLTCRPTSLRFIADKLQRGVNLFELS